MAKDRIELLIVDNDPIFRLGFVTALAAYPDFDIISQAKNLNHALLELEQGLIPDLLVIALNFQYFARQKGIALKLCRKIRREYDSLPIFVLSSSSKPKILKTLKTLDIQGYCNKGTDIETIVRAMRSIVEGEVYWQKNKVSTSNFWRTNLSRLSQAGKKDITTTLAKVNERLQAPHLSDFDRLFLSGRKRELSVASWLVDRLIISDIVTTQKQLPLTTALIPIDNSNQSCLLSAHQVITELIQQESVIAQIFKKVFMSIDLAVVNRTNIILEIDILQPRKRQELLYLVLSKLYKLIQTLQQQKQSKLSMTENLYAIWQSASVDFFFGHYGGLIDITEEQFLEIIEQEADIVQNNIFSQVYFASDLFTYFLEKEPLIVDFVSYSYDSPEAKLRAEILVENLIILVANAILQVLLNNFYNVEIFKYNLYHPRYRSSREIARFRNDLSWRYRQEKYWDNPNNIFASRYRLLILQQNGIQTFFIYASRIEELNQLEGLPWLATMVIEIRDAISPRLKSIIASLGSSVIYILTQVIGKGIGLIAKGIIQGIGNSVQDANFSSKNKD